MSRAGWNVHGWWIGPPEDEPEKHPPRAKCGGPGKCVVCGHKVTRWAPDPRGLPVTPCSFCQEPIVWAETVPNPNARSKAGAEAKLIPFDADPSTHSKATWALTPRAGRRPTCSEMIPRKALAFRAAKQPTYLKHVKTCTQVAKWPKGQYLVAQRERSGR